MATAIRSQRKHASAAFKYAADPLNCCVRIPASALTLDGFRLWLESEELPEKLRAAFIDEGIYLDMSREELQTHAAVKAEISRVLMNLNHERKTGFFFLDGVLITNVEAGVSNNTDGTFVLKSSIRSGRVRFVAGKSRKRRYTEIEGTPDWVIEIVSDGSVQKDTKQLKVAYHKARISEYWLIDARAEDLLFQIYHWWKSAYAAAPKSDGWQKSRVFECGFRLRRERNGLRMWEYMLDIRPVQ